MLPQFAYLFLMDLTRLQSQTFDAYAAKEPGFADAMLQAYISAFQEPRTQKVTHLFLQAINRIAMSHKGGTGRYKAVANHYKVYFQRYGKTCVSTYSATHSGLLELLTYWRKQTPSMHGVQFKSVLNPSHYYLVDLIDNNIVCMGKDGAVTTKESLDTLMVNLDYECIVHSGLSQTGNVKTLTIHALQKVFNEYDEDIKIAVTEDEKIAAIAKMIQHIAQAHPFEDGNIRTAYIALNKLLRDHGLRLSILLDPNRLDCCDLALVVTMIKEGQRIYSSLLSHTNPLEFQAITTDSYFQTITCPPCDIGSVFCERFLHDVVLAERLPQQEPPSLSFFKPASNQKAIEAFAQLKFNNEACRPLIAKHIIAENYEIALRNACFHCEFAVIQFLLDFFPSLDLNGQSKDGNTALDWLNTHSSNDELNAVLSRLSGLGALTKEQLLQNSPK